MFERLEPILRLVCVALAAVLLCQVVRVVAHGDPLGRSSIPALPTLALAPPPVETKVSTNAPAKGKHSMHGGPKKADLPPLLQERIDHIKESEILAPFIRPEPMALLGIAGEDAFVRAPDGQSKMLKEGEEVSGVKLLRIGANRVLVEQDGEKKELTVFSGLGGDSLLPPEKESPTNTPTMPKHKEIP
jgi:hypothetical protein